MYKEEQKNMGFFDDVDVNNIEEETVDESKIKKKSKEDVQIEEEISDVSNSDDEANGKSLMDELMPEKQDVVNPIEGNSDENLPGETRNVLSENVDKTNEGKKVEKNVKTESEFEEVKKETSQSSKPVQSNSGAVPIVNGTVIAEDTVIKGDVYTKSSVSVYGNVKGNVTSDESVNISAGGTVSGLISSKDVSVGESGRILKGGITSSGNVVVSENAVVVGGITSSSSVLIMGAVKGDIESKEKVLLKSTAIVQGNIKAASIVIEDGASIDGTCTQAYAKIKPSDFFKDMNLDEINEE